ncbi:hypothetical protein ACIBHX_42685 [Nonomuraea sp. NPDC050536]|uniref:hypothetical protein n=1 Tax=Nonomuraea sp. NPDC050536 TaxID=3364366 RepID=UPI0037C68ABA
MQEWPSRTQFTISQHQPNPPKGVAVPLRLRWRPILSVLLSLSVLSALSVAGTSAVNADTGPFKAKTAIDGRGSMNPGDRTHPNAYLTDADIYITCQDSGPTVDGSGIWDYTSDKLWIPDAYVRTGTDGFLPGVPRCLAIGIDGHASQGSLHGPYKAKTDTDGRGSPNPGVTFYFWGYSWARAHLLLGSHPRHPATARPHPPR